MGVDESSTYRLSYQDGAVASLSASIRVQGSIDVRVFGEHESLRLVESFYLSHRLELSAVRPRRSAQRAPTQQGLASRVKKGLRESAAPKVWRRRATGWRSLNGSLALPCPLKAMVINSKLLKLRGAFSKV